MSLTSCLKKAGKALSGKDRAAVLAAAREHRAAGLGANEAAVKAVDDVLKSLRAELAPLAFGKQTIKESDNGHREQASVQPAATPAAAQGLQERSSVRGSTGEVRLDRGPQQGVARPLQGLPATVEVDGRKVTFGPFQPAHDAAAAYMKKAGLPYDPPKTYARVDRARAARIAAAYEAMEHRPNDFVVARAYEAMIRETAEQYEAMLATGLKVEFIDAAKGDPYGNPRHAILDVVNNNHLWVYPTDDGFGSSSDFDPTENPLLATTKYVISGKQARANDIFRAVHDYFGHIKDGVGFRADGEENAWRSHSAMYSDPARLAMTSETRGQNSWLNFGPHGEANRTAKSSATIYAPQKTGLLPHWVAEDGRTDESLKLSKEKRQLAGPNADLKHEHIFYSALQREMDKAVNAKALPVIGWKQALTSLVNKGLVKKDEVAWSGIEEWLDAKSKAPEGQGELFEVPKISKTDVMRFIANNGLTVREVTLSGPGEAEKEAFIRERAQELYDEWNSNFDDEVESYMDRYFEHPYGTHEIDDPEEIQALIDDGRVEGDFEHSEGDPYPQKLYAVVDPNSRRGSYESIFADVGEADDKTTELNDEAYHDLEASYRDENTRTLSDFEDEAESDWDGNEDGEGDQKFETYSLPGGTNYREVLLTLGDVSPDGQVSSTHWDQKNVVAHVRLKDRMADTPSASWSGTGGRVLFVEEIQSDWAQEGREKGFKREPTPEEQEKIDEAMRVYAQRKQAVEEARNKLEVARDIYRELDHQLVDAQAKRGPELDRAAERHNEMSAKVNELLEKMDDAIYQQRIAEREVSELNKPINGVARAPFVDKTDKWVELALKRIIRMAAEEGYDKVAFATGQQNADRYDLQQEVEKIVYTKNSDDRWHVAVYGNGHGSRLIVNETMDEAKIKATLGQELTQKIVNDKGQRYDLQIQRPVGPDADTGSGVISGLDLKMGGEGMLTFYDSIIPKALGRILPKLGGDKQLEKVTLSYPKGARNSASGRDVPHEHLGFAINDKMRISAMGGLPLFMKNPIELKSITVPEIKGRIKGKWTDLRSVLLQSLGGRQIAEVYGRDLPQLPQYQKLVQLMQAGVNDIAAKADTVANEWGKLKDEKPLAGLMHDATLAQMDPAKPYVPGDSESQYRELRARWDQLSPKAQQVYVQARDMYEGHYAEVRQAIRDRIERAEGLSTPKKSEMLKRMDGEFFERIKGVYFPLARFGDYVVVVRDQDGKTAAVSRAETKAEADALRRDLKGEFGAGYTVSAVVKAAEFNAKRDAVGSEFLSTLFKVLDETGIGEDLQDEINQLVLTSMPDLSWAKHGIHRKGTAGFSQDARRAFANNMFHGSRYLQRVRYGDRLEGKLAEAERYVKGRAELTESVKEQQVLDEMRKRHELLMNPVTHPWATNLTSFGFLFHLGLAPASALVNVSQTPLIAGPILAGKFGARAYAALMTASVDTMKAKNNVVAALRGDEQLAVQKAIDEGTIDVTLAQDLAGIAQGNDTNLAWKMRPVMRAAAFLFHHAERFNRQATFLAAYRLARSAGASHEAAFDTATDLTYAGHFDYASSNRPRVMQGNVAKVVTQFKQYSQNMTYTLANSVRLSLKGDRQAMKTLGGLLVMNGMAAGALGVPLVAQLFSLASMIGGSDDEPWDAKAAFQNYLTDAFGQKPAEVLMHGVSRLGPADISGRVSLDLYKMWFPDVNEALAGEAAYDSFLAGMLGPVIGGVGVNTAKAFALISDGEWEKAMELILPLSPLRSGMKAYRFAEEGARDKSGVPIKDEVSAAGIAAQAIGFRPSEVANAQEGRGVVMELDKRLQQRRGELMDHFAKAAMSGDDTATPLAAIQHWNEVNPARVIAPLHLQQSVARRAQRIAQSQQGVYLPGKRRDLLQEGRFAVEQE